MPSFETAEVTEVLAERTGLQRVATPGGRAYALTQLTGPVSLSADFNAIDAAFFPAGDQKSFLVVNIGRPGDEAWGEAKPKFAYDDVVRTV